MKHLGIFGCITALALAGTATGALACPSIEAKGKSLYHDSEDLWSPLALDVIAGGNQDLDYCSFDELDGSDRAPVGYVAVRPDFELNYERTRDHDLRFSLVGACDTVLLINTGAGNWFFSDDAGGDSVDSELRLINPSDGVYDIWVGTYDTANCDASLSIETMPASES